MGYRIVYGGGPPRGRKSRLGLWTAVFLLVFVSAVRLSWPEGTRYLREILEPRAQMTQAFSRMVEDVENGQGMGEAVTAFCRTVVTDGLAE